MCCYPQGCNEVIVDDVAYTTPNTALRLVENIHKRFYLFHNVLEVGDYLSAIGTVGVCRTVIQRKS